MNPPELSTERSELRNPETVPEFLEHHAHRHIAANLLGRNAHDVRNQPRPLLELDDRHHVRHLFLESAVIDAVIDDEAEYGSSPAGRNPGIALETAAGAGKGRRKPVTAAGNAARHDAPRRARRGPH